MLPTPRARGEVHAVFDNHAIARRLTGTGRASGTGTRGGRITRARSSSPRHSTYTSIQLTMRYNQKLWIGSVKKAAYPSA